MKKKGFTLVELLIVIAVIAVLFIVLLSKVEFASNKAKDSGVLTDFRSYQIGIEQTLRENEYSTLDLAEINADLKRNLDKNMQFELLDGEYQSKNLNPYGYRYVLEIEGNALKVYSINEQSRSVLEVGNNNVYADDATLTVYSNGSVMQWGDMTVKQVKPEVEKYYNIETLKEQDVQDNKDKGSNILTYTVTTSVNTNDGGVGGVATPATKDGLVNSEIILVATANAGYQFTGWTDASGNVISTNATYATTIKTSGNSYIANFSKLYYWDVFNAVNTVTGYKVTDIITTQANQESDGFTSFVVNGTRLTIDTNGSNPYSYTVDGYSHGVYINTPVGGTCTVVNTNNTVRYLDTGQIHGKLTANSALDCDGFFAYYCGSQSTNGVLQSYSVRVYLLKENAVASKGTTSVGTVSSTNPSEYPLNGASGSNWYIKK